MILKKSQLGPPGEGHNQLHLIQDLGLGFYGILTEVRTVTLDTSEQQYVSPPPSK